MTKRAISTGGYPIEVSTPTDPVTIPAATTSAIGGVKKMAAQTDSTATDVAGLVADFNALLAKARTAGLVMITMKVVAQKKWWVSPLLSVLKAFVYARIVKEKHFKPLSGFIARWGFKFKTEK